jgi:hypothetical protein
LGGKPAQQQQAPKGRQCLPLSPFRGSGVFAGSLSRD